MSQGITIPGQVEFMKGRSNPWDRFETQPYAMHHSQPHCSLAAPAPRQSHPQLSIWFSLGTGDAVASSFHSRPCSTMIHGDEGAEQQARG